MSKKPEPFVELELSTAEASGDAEQTQADLKVVDPSDGKAVLEKLITETKSK